MIYDIIIIGAGPSGLTAGLYAARYKMKTLIISKTMGGTATMAHKICNFPSHEQIKGFELVQKMIKQVEILGIEVIYDQVKKIEKKKNNFIVLLEGKKFQAKKIIFAGGTERTKLNIPGEGKFLGKGISYCATCDAAFFKGKITAVVGGSDAALTSALLLSEYSTKVYIIYRQNKFFRADPTWVELVEKEKNIEVLFNEEITEIIGKEKLEELNLRSGKKLKLDGVFIEVGSVPETEFLKPLGLKLNEKGYIMTDKDQKTNIEGFFASGDVTNNSLKQIITACGEGAVAAYMAYQEIKKEED